MSRLVSDATCSDLRAMSPSLCGNSPYPRKSLTYRIFIFADIIPPVFPFVKPSVQNFFSIIKNRKLPHPIKECGKTVLILIFNTKAAPFQGV